MRTEADAVLFALGMRSFGIESTVIVRGRFFAFSACHAVLTAATLIAVLSCAYGLLLPVMQPLLTGNAIGMYRWTFVAAILSAAVWLGVLLMRHAELLSDGLRQGVERIKRFVIG